MKEHLIHLLNLLTYDDLDENEKIDACVEYIKDQLKNETLSNTENSNTEKQM